MNDDTPPTPLDILAAADQAYLALVSAENAVVQAQKALQDAKEAFTQVCARGESIAMSPNRIKRAAMERIELLCSTGQMPALETKAAARAKPKPKKKANEPAARRGRPPKNAPQTPEIPAAEAEALTAEVAEPMDELPTVS